MSPVSQRRSIFPGHPLRLRSPMGASTGTSRRPHTDATGAPRPWRWRIARCAAYETSRLTNRFGPGVARPPTTAHQLIGATVKLCAGSPR